MKNKTKAFKNDLLREVAVVMAVQNKGVASYDEIIEKVESKGGKITDKQVRKACENLQKRQIFSVDLKSLDKDGNTIKRYAMRRIGLSVPEIGQIDAVVDAKEDMGEEVRALIEYLKASKKNAKIKPNNYYDVDVTFKTDGEVFGFMPDGKELSNAHYRDENNMVVFYRKHFRGWLRSALPLANKYRNTITRIFTFNGTSNANGNTLAKNTFIINVDKTHNGSGRGERKLEYLPDGTEIYTKFRVSESDFTPVEFKKFLEIAGETVAFGGCSKISNGLLHLEEFKLGDKVWQDNK